MNTSAKGAAYERGFKKRLYERGAQFVVRAAASKGPYDLFAVFPDMLIGYQLKGYRMSCVAAVRALAKMPMTWNCESRFVHVSATLHYCEHTAA